MEKSSSSKDDEGNEIAQLTRNRLVTIKVGKKNKQQECHFRILGNYTKHSGKWFPDNKEQVWNSKLVKGSH